MLSENKGELTKEAVPVSTNLVSEPEEKTSLSDCIGLERFSSKKKLFRVTAYVMRFISRLKERIRNTRSIQNPPDQSLSVKELEAAELLWIREVQKSIVCGDLGCYWMTRESIVAEEGWRILHCHIKQSNQRCCLQNTT